MIGQKKDVGKKDVPPYNAIGALHDSIDAPHMSEAHSSDPIGAVFIVRIPIYRVLGRNKKFSWFIMKRVNKLDCAH